MIKIGILGLQGAIEEHEETLKKASNEINEKIDIVRVILPDDLNDVDGLILPGGESTAMTLIGNKNGMNEAVKNALNSGLPAFGTCAGAILLAKTVRRNFNSESKNGLYPQLDIEIIRNGYGRQVDSFSIDLDITGIGKFRGVFIRAPIIKTVSEDVEILAYGRGTPVFVRQKNVFASTFHPELANDTRVHILFLNSIIKQ